jgi:phosphohistidine swiveling domain-containing protein
MKNSKWIDWLNETNKEDAIHGHQGELLGGKGANLRRLATLAMPVPRGFVITTDAYRAFATANKLELLVDSDPASLPARIIQAPLPADLRAAILAGYEQLGIGAVAVRSSGTAEDLATASFAGQHDTFLNVVGSEAVLTAVQACWASLWTPRAVAYRRQRDWVQPVALAVVVQEMVPAEAAGVTFTANPVTGNRDETTISAVRGLGERLVSGEGMADEWVVRGMGADALAVCQRHAENAITEEQALAVAALARRIERSFGAPQDVEWAIDGNGNLFVLQARPMTALPEPVETVSWRAPIGSGWMRNFRLGEWLPDPVTPLCESWLLDRIEEGEVASQEHDFGLRPRPPYHVLVHGWYFSSPIGGGLPLRGVAKAVTRHPRQLAALVLSTNRPDLAERPFIAPVARRWQNELLPRYQHLVAFSEAQLHSDSPADLIRAIDAVASMAGEYLWALSVVGGHAWKAEHALARFCREYLPERAAHSHQELLLGLTVGLPAPYPAAPAHAVQSLDWIRPTLGETQRGPMPTDDLVERRTRMAENRRSTEDACRRALANRPRLRSRFNKLLALAQRYAILREEQASWFTGGWPFLRCAVLRLGEDLRQRGAIDQVEDVFFLTRAELEWNLELGKVQAGAPAVADSLPSVVVARRREWERQRRLNPPLVLGNPLSARLIARATNAMRVPGLEAGSSSGAAGHAGHDVLTGMPASPGTASGPVRVVHGPEDFERFQSGEVLVAQVTTPAWTPLFGRAAAVVTAGGSLAAHASLVAREYGVPAVVGAGDATARLRDGQAVLVDGNRGQVVLLGLRDTENTED